MEKYIKSQKINVMRTMYNKEKISRRQALSTAGKIAISVIITGVVAGVGGYLAGTYTSRPAKKRIVFVKWHWDSPEEERRWTEVVTKFTNETGINLTLMTETWDKIDDKLIAAAKAGSVWADAALILHWDYSYLAKKAKILADITERAEKEIDLGDWKEGLIDQMRIDGKLYGLPWRRGGFALLYNEEIFQKAGLTRPPQTMEETIEWAKTIKEKVPEVYPFGQVGNKQSAVWSRWENVFYAYGGDWLNPEGTDVADSFMDAATKAFKWYQDMLPYCQPSVLEDNDDDVLRLFGAGEVGFLQDHTSAWPQLQAWSTPEILKVSKWAYWPGPTSCGGWDIVITRNTPNFEETWEFVKWITRPENMAIEMGEPPARKSAIPLSDFAKYPEPLVKQPLKSTLATPWSVEIRPILFELVQKTLAGKIDPESAATALRDAVKKYL